jgi:hypothetical protein
MSAEAVRTPTPRFLSLDRGDVVDRAGIEAEPREHAVGGRWRGAGPAPVADGEAVPPILGGGEKVERRQQGIGRRDRRVGDAGDGEGQALSLEAAVALPRDLGGEPVAGGCAEAVGEPASQHDGIPRRRRVAGEQRVAGSRRQQRDAGEGAAAAIRLAQPGEAGGDRAGRRYDEGNPVLPGQVAEECGVKAAAAGRHDLAVARIFDQTLGQGVDQAEAHPEQDQQRRQHRGEAEHLAQHDPPVMAEIPGG